MDDSLYKQVNRPEVKIQDGTPLNCALVCLYSCPGCLDMQINGSQTTMQKCEDKVMGTCSAKEPGHCNVIDIIVRQPDCGLR